MHSLRPALICDTMYSELERCNTLVPGLDQALGARLRVCCFDSDVLDKCHGLAWRE